MVNHKKTSRYIGHPYCIYMRRPNSFGKNPTGHFAVNNYGFGGTKPTTLEKPVGKTRIICIGGSTTEMVWKAPDNTYPYWLNQYLGDKYEVLNAGVSGYTTAEMLINFELRLLDFKPDIIVIYAGFNDCKGAGMYGGFKSDYSHARVAGGFLPVDTDRRMIKNILPEGSVWREDAVPEIAIQTFKRNMKSMVAVALAHKIVPVVVEMNLKPNNNYQWNLVDGVNRNNEAIRNFIPNYIQVKGLTDNDFIDGCHFNTSGMKKMGKQIARGIAKL